MLLRSSDQHLCSRADGEISGPGQGTGFLNRLNDWFQQEKQPATESPDWPFVGGWFIYLGYELAAEIEPVVQFPAAVDGFPIAFASRCPAAIYTQPNRPGKLQLVAESSGLLAQMREELEGLHSVPSPESMGLDTLEPDPPEALYRLLSKFMNISLTGMYSR